MPKNRNNKRIRWDLMDIHLLEKNVALCEQQIAFNQIMLDASGDPTSGVTKSKTQINKEISDQNRKLHKLQKEISRVQSAYKKSSAKDRRHSKEQAAKRNATSW